MTTATQIKLTKAKARKVLQVVDAGLVSGLGKAEPGQMCVMAALNYALGFDHGDKVECVHPIVRRLDIALNDSSWSSKKARAKGMRREAIAKLGSVGIDAERYMQYVALHIIKEILPSRLRDIGLEKNAKECESATNLSAASDAAHYAAHAAPRLMRVVAASAVRAVRAASDAARHARHAARYAATDEVLCQLADISTRALIECGSQGSQWLDICEE